MTRHHGAVPLFAEHVQVLAHAPAMDIVRKHDDLERFPVCLLESQRACSIHWHAGGAQKVVNDQLDPGAVSGSDSYQSMPLRRIT